MQRHAMPVMPVAIPMTATPSSASSASAATEISAVSTRRDISSYERAISILTGYVVGSLVAT